jgi:EpsI family protein
MKSKKWHFWVLLVFLLLGGTVVNMWERIGEASVVRRELKEFPTAIGGWRQRGVDTRFDAQTESVLRADDYLARDYTLSDGRTVNFYVGYYATQRNGATYHSPLNCLPGAGWTLNEPAKVQITPANGGAAFEANRYIIQNGDTRQLLLYWYQGRGRTVASEYWGKIYTVVDSVKRRRSDGAMVRVIVPIQKSEADALALATDLAATASPALPDFIPN